MPQTVLITGGAGFIGSHLADQLLAAGHHVRVLDNLSAQVHATRSRPEYLDPDVELLIGDVRDADAVARALRGVTRVCHLAAAVGVGQSMYHVDEYTSNNVLGTAVLLQAILRKPVERLVVASSMSVYGEGCYRSVDGRPATATERSPEQLKRRQWEVRDAAGNALVPIPTPESKTPAIGSIYALSKFDQERMCLLIGQAYNVPTVALRFFNVYGPRQALSNPYTGVLAIFASRLLNGNPPLIFEDGQQRRDFVSVHDVARACCLALDRERLEARVLNIGSGRSFSILEIAERLANVLGRPIAAELTGRYRVGDIRHCFADVSCAQQTLGFSAEIDFDQGLEELSEWLRDAEATDSVSEAYAELTSRGLAI
jgi:dTDP-L-rhamnose 4-epimerase